MIYVMIESETDMTIDKRADMIIINAWTHILLWKICFAKQKFGVSGVFCDGIISLFAKCISV